jgi:hypothetical protein
MDGSEGATGRSSAAERAPGTLTGDIIPCPTCGLLAPVLNPPAGYVWLEARCAEGHFVVLTPAVTEHLLRLNGPAFS